MLHCQYLSCHNLFIIIITVEITLKIIIVYHIFSSSIISMILDPYHQYHHVTDPPPHHQLIQQYRHHHHQHYRHRHHDFSGKGKLNQRCQSGIKQKDEGYADRGEPDDYEKAAVDKDMLIEVRETMMTKLLKMMMKRMRDMLIEVSGQMM